MSDALYRGTRLRTFNVLEDSNREALAIEIDTSLTSSRLVRVFEQLRDERGLPRRLRTNNGPEFLYTGENCRERCEIGVNHPGKDPGKGGFPASRGAPENQGGEGSPVKESVKQLPFAQKMLLTDKGLKGSGPYSLCKWWLIQGHAVSCLSAF